MVSHPRDLVQQGRLLEPEFKEVDSRTVRSRPASRPANGGKTSVLWEWCREGLSAVFNHSNCYPVTFTRAALYVFAFGLSALWMELVWNSASLLVPAGTAVPALHFLAINCHYLLFSYHLKVSTLSCDFKA